MPSDPSSPLPTHAPPDAPGREIELKLRFDDETAYQKIRLRLDPKQEIVGVVQENHFLETSARDLRQHGIGYRLREEGPTGGPTIWILTVKGPPAPRDRRPLDAPRGDPSILTVRSEEEAIISAEAAHAILGGVVDPLAALHTHLGAGPLLDQVQLALGNAIPAHVGSFKNLRFRLPLVLELPNGPFAGLVELDRTHFARGPAPGGPAPGAGPPGSAVQHELVVHHELEMEVPAPLVEAGQAPIVEERLRALIVEQGVEARPSRGKASRFFAALEGDAI